MRLRPRVEVLCFRDSRVLSGHRGYVVFPGGGIDPAESAIDAARRECAEEASRRLINCNFAHPPTVQKWPEGYKNDGMSWKKPFDGGLTHWITASVSESVVPELQHADYETSLSWKPIRDVIEYLKRTAHNGWDEDNKVRLAILEGQLALREPVPAKEASPIFAYHFGA